MTTGGDIFGPLDPAPIDTGRRPNGTFAPGHRCSRPRGRRNNRTLALEALMEGEARAVTRSVIKAAIAGDMVAAKLVLDRIAPRPRGRPVAWEDAPDIDISTPAGRAEMLAAIVAASINGEISPEDAQSLGAGLEIIRRNEEHEKLIADVEAIKERLGIGHGV